MDARAKATIFDSVTSRVTNVTGSFVGEGPHRGEVTIRVNVDPKSPWGSLRGAVLTLATRGKDETGASQAPAVAASLLPPLATLDGFGVSGPPPATAKPLGQNPAAR